ncbi:hypothetical protein V6N13_037587 [Hibiscus sabdariffa]
MFDEILSRDDEVIPSTGVQDLSDGPPDSLKDEVLVMAFEEPIQDSFGLSRATTHHDMSNFNPNQVIFDFYLNRRVTDVDMNMDISKLNFVVYLTSEALKFDSIKGTSNVDSSMSYEIENDRLRELERAKVITTIGNIVKKLCVLEAHSMNWIALVFKNASSERDISNSTRKGRSKGEDPTLRSVALDHIVMDQTQGQECLMVLVETMTFEEVNSNGVLFQQIFLKDTNERKVAYIAGPAHNWWGFTIDEFVKFYVFKFGMSTFVFQKAPWGPCYFNLKTRMTVGKKESAGGRKAQAMFVQFVLEPIWQTYHAALELKGKTTITKHIHNDLLEEERFEMVIWVTTSKQFNVVKLQDDIASALNLKEDLAKEGDELKRASILSEMLNKVRKHVLILDDLWDGVSLRMLGSLSQVAVTDASWC